MLQYAVDSRMFHIVQSLSDSRQWGTRRQYITQRHVMREFLYLHTILRGNYFLLSTGGFEALTRCVDALARTIENCERCAAPMLLWGTSCLLKNNYWALFLLLWCWYQYVIYWHIHIGCVLFLFRDRRESIYGQDTVERG